MRAIVGVAVFSCAAMGNACARGETLGPPDPRIALAGFSQSSPIHVTLMTSEGNVRCAVDPSRAPVATAMFVGFSTGRAPFRDPKTRAVTTRPMYRDLPIFRAISNGYFQTGCPLGNGTGTPGYRVPIESHEDDSARLATPGALFIAHYQPPPDRADPDPPPPADAIGSQFVVSLADMSSSAGTVTVIGACGDLEIVRRITDRVANRDRVMLNEVRVERAP